jgi:hypothetical protein
MKHSETTKKKISARMQQLVLENPDKFKARKKEPKHIICWNCKKSIYVMQSSKTKFCNKECRSAAVKQGYFKGIGGGNRIGAGRSKSGWYNGIYCNSSYELAWVLWSLKNNIRFSRNTKGFDYINSSQTTSKYYPDFFLIDENQYIEIKGYKEKEFDNKIKCFPYSIQIIDKSKILPILIWVKQTYGNDFLKLYEGNPHEQKINKCQICGNPATNKFCSRKCSGYGVKKLKDFVS